MARIRCNRILTSVASAYFMYVTYVYIIDQARGQDGWILAEFSFFVFMDRDEVKLHKKGTRPIPNHLDRTSLVNNRFIISHKEH